MVEDDRARPGRPFGLAQVEAARDQLDDTKVRAPKPQVETQPQYV